jgi:hypothetical protein
MGQIHVQGTSNVQPLFHRLGHCRQDGAMSIAAIFQQTVNFYAS